MKCKQCGFENPAQAKFCSGCGNRLESEPALQPESSRILEPSTQIVEEDLVIEQPAYGSDSSSMERIWYYVKNGQSVGPISAAEISALLSQKELGAQSYIWKKGLPDWTQIGQSELASLCTAPKPQPAPVQPQSQPVSSGGYASGASAGWQNHPVMDAEVSDRQPESQKEWYYVSNGQTCGPYVEDVMIQLIRQKTLNEDSYVWSEGMSDWRLLSTTELARYLNPSNAAGAASGSNAYGTRQNTPASSAAARPGALQPRSILLYIILTIVTCGIFGIFWYYLVAKDINTLAYERNSQPGCDPVLSLVFIFLSCGIYQIYFFWKEGTTIYQLARSPRVSNNAGILALLGLFLPLASLAILQDQINTVIRDE